MDISVDGGPQPYKVMKQNHLAWEISIFWELHPVDRSIPNQECLMKQFLFGLTIDDPEH